MAGYEEVMTLGCIRNVLIWYVNILHVYVSEHMQS